MVSVTSSRRGFTLIELLVAVAIIALLIAILLPTLGRAKELSKRTVGASRLKGVGQALNIYAADFDGRLQWCRRATYATTGQSGIGTSFGDYIQRVEMQWWNWNTVGNAFMISRTQGQPMFGASKIWVSAGPDTENPFTMKKYGDPNTPDTFWYAINNYTSWANPGGTKAIVYGSYYNFMGEVGNNTGPIVPSTNQGGAVYFQDSGLTINDDRFNGAGLRTRLKDVAPNSLMMQDVAGQGATGTGAFFAANYLSRPGGYLQQSYGATGSTTLGAALGLGSGAHAYVAGNFFVENETDIAGVNAMFADWSVEWASKGNLARVYYKDQGDGKTRILFVASR